MSRILRAVVAATLLLASACQGGNVAAPDRPLAQEPASLRQCAADRDAIAPDGRTLVAAYPDEPAAWHPAFHGDAAAIDLQALWGLPLYAYDQAGQLRPALLRQALVEEQEGTRRQVRLQLCPGAWSDGRPVVAEDVVATIDALRTSPTPWAVEGIVEAAAADGDVVLTLDGIGGRWQHLLAGLGSVLPAHVLAVDGLEAWRDGVPVSGGAFHLDEVVPGASRRFVANPDSPLGAPRQAAIDVQVVPRFELALGLLVEDRVDVALGHLALEAGPRIAGVEDRPLEGQVARGNTLLTWQWNDDASVAGDAGRRAIQDGLDLTAFAEGLLVPEGDLVRAFTPGVAGPPVPDPARLDDGLPEVVVSAPRWHDLPALVARGARDSLERRGLTVRTTSDEADVLAREPLGDATIRTRRLGPWPALSPFWRGETVPEALHLADGAPVATGSAAEAAAVAVWTGTGEVPLVEVGVSHAWADVDGVVASGWPGIGFTSAAQWVLTGP